MHTFCLFDLLYLRRRRKGSSIVFVRLVDPGLFDSLLLGLRRENIGDGANAVVSGRVADSHNGGGHLHTVTVPVSAAGVQIPTVAKGRIVGAGAAEGRGTSGAKGVPFKRGVRRRVVR